ncbi:MAG: T9SS type A sorting domain-containing protein, partial [Bacteroidales bacterium]|nr:T9SS type A sorting domain-containing protein [Bacteroidales bacterium]
DPGYEFHINVLKNDYDPNGDSFKIVSSSPLGTIISDSIIIVSFNNQSLYNFYGGFFEGSYRIADTIPWMNNLFDDGRFYIKFNDIKFYDSLDINNVNAILNCFGSQFEIPRLSWAKYIVLKNSGKTSIFSNAFWIGGVDEANDLHLSSGFSDYYPGPVSDIYDTLYDSKWFKVWKLTKEEVSYHKSNWWQSGYQPIENIASWPGNGDLELGQTEQIAPYYDYNNDGFYDPMAGDWPVIKGDQALFFVYNDARNVYTLNERHPLGIEIRAMAYAFNEPTDSALWHTTFLHYEIANKSDTTYYETFVGSFNDIDLGNAWDDYIGCDVEGGYYFGYNGEDNDSSITPPGDSISHNYGYHPPAQAVMILGGPYMDDDGIDNPKYDANNQQICDMSINGLNFGDTIVDNERLGMTGFMYANNGGPYYCIDPQYDPEYYGFMRGYWKDYTRALYGGNGHISSSASGPICNFIYPGDSDTCNWGTNGILPNGGYNQNGLFWTEEQVGNDPGDRRGLGSSGPFTFKPGDIHEIDLAFVWARDYDGDPWSSVELLKQRCKSIKEKFENNPDFFSGIKNYTEHNKQLIIYPNPVYEELTINMPQKVIHGYISIFNIKGEKLIESEFSDTHEMVINIRQLQQGLYIVKLFNGLDNHIAKFIKK